jgi:cell wall-associated NlpC family hydrolase
VTLHPDTARMHRRGWLTAAAVTLALLAGAAPASAQSGGTSTGTGDGGGGDTSAGGGIPPAPTTPGASAGLLPNGDAVPPAGAPPQVVKAINRANRINHLPYEYGGGHKSFKPDDGYDCSGAVSYMLRGLGRQALQSPLPSGPLAKWGVPGEGQWITVYANGGHAYAVVAGLRWDTSGGKGPRWHEDMRSSAGYKIRHYEGF